MTNSKILCIYHGNCADGFGAAWAVRRALGAENVEFHAGVYQESPPDVRGRHVVIVDFSYKRPILLEMGEQALSVLVLDHHKSAAEDLAGLPKPLWSWQSYLDDTVRGIVTDGTDPALPRVLFDMERSGAMIAWDFFHPGQPAPQLLQHIQDRDLWRFALEGTREVQACLFSHPYDFDLWDKLMATDPQGLAVEGAAIERKHHKDIAEFIGVAARRMVIAGYNVPVLNAPYFWSSDAGHLLAQGEPFAACYWDTPEGRVFSLRSADDGLDVSAIAKQYGGGGHKHAAGFRVGFEQAKHSAVVKAVAPTSAQCAAAIGVLVRHGLLPKHADTETYLRTYDAMKEALIAAAPDREQAAQMGEPSPWGFDDLDPEWIDCRMVAMREAIAAAAEPAQREGE